MADTKGRRRRGPTKERKKRAPSARVRGGGKVNRRLEQLADMYKRNNPGKDCRFVYHPEHKPDMSNVISRQADGYRLVHMSDLGDDIVEAIPGSEPDDLVRVGDVVLMSIDEGVRKEIQAELDEAATAELERVEEDFYGAIEQIADKTEDRYKPRARGRSVIEEREREVEVPESHKET